MIITQMGRWLGALRDDPDARDFRYRAPDIALPPVVDIAHLLPEPWSQGRLGSCSAHAGAALISWLYQGYMPSRLALYYHARLIEGTQMIDMGAQLRSIMKVLQKAGEVPEETWGYDVNRFAEEPPKDARAASHTLAKYARLVSEREMLVCLATGTPFILGIEVPEYFDDADIAAHGVFRLPTSSVGTLGRHAVVAVGYDLDFKNNPDFIASGVDPALVANVALKVRNSWGFDWGLNGHFWLPLPHASNPSTGGDAWFGHKLITHIDEPGGALVAGIKIEGTFNS